MKPMTSILQKPILAQWHDPVGQATEPRIYGKDAAGPLQCAAPARILRAGEPAHGAGNINLTF
jgi:hypothetical protein